MNNKKNILWSLFSLLLAAFSLWAVLLQSGEMPLRQLWEEIVAAKMPFLLLAGACSVLYILMECLAIRCILSGIGYARHFRRCLVYSASDIYFSAVTPSATGGQPASAMFMIRDGIPPGVVTVTLIVNLIMYTVSLVILGVGAVVSHFRLFFGFRLVSKILIAIGFAVLSALTLVFFILLSSGNRVFGILAGFYRFLFSHRLIRRLDYRLARLKKAETEFDECVLLMKNKPGTLWRAFVCNFIQRAARIAVPVFVYLALGGGLSRAESIFASQSFVTIGYNCVPVPGGIGVADFLMIDGFSDLMPMEDALHVEMLSRSIAFYICVAVSGIVVLIGYILHRRRERR